MTVTCSCIAMASSIERFLAQVPSGGLRVGQRLVVARQQAEAALDNLQAVVTAVASAP